MPSLPSDLAFRVRRSFSRAGLGVLLASQVWLAACSGTPPPTAVGADGPAGLVSAAPASTTAVLGVPITVTPQESWQDGVLYFVVVDRFADGDSGNNRGVDRAAKGTFHGGDLVGLRQQLDEIADLGVTAIWITPVVKNIEGFVTGAGFPDWGYHGYWADDFYALDPRFGTEAELKALVDDAHARGIKVLLDVVYNHAGYDSVPHQGPQDPRLVPHRGPGHLRRGRPDLLRLGPAGLQDRAARGGRLSLMAAHLGLAKRVGLDGFRLDTVKHVDHPFWQEHRKRIREQIGEDFFLIGEVWGGDAQSLDPWFDGDEMDAGFDFSFQGSALGWVQGRGRTVAFDRYLKSREKVRAGHLLSPYLSSHDVPGALFQLDGDRELFRLAAFLELTAAGLPMIYYGEEVGRPGGDWPDNRSDMPWGNRRVQPGAGKPRDEALRADYKKLIAIRRAHKALSRGVYTGLSSGRRPAGVPAPGRGERGRGGGGGQPGERAGDGGVRRAGRVGRRSRAGRVERRGRAGFRGERRADRSGGGSAELPGFFARRPEKFLDTASTGGAGKSPVPVSSRLQWQEEAMAEVTLKGIKKAYGPVTVIPNLDLEIEDHEFMVLVGPSGCGKSTALRMIAGLEEITGGTIEIGDRVVNDVPPKDRDIAMVFQSYALYPHMTVRENLEFGLKIRKTPKDEMDRRVDEAAQILGITEFLDRKPKQLSGGQRQRVAAGPRHRAQARRLPVRRAALEPRRQAARPDAGRDLQAPEGPPDHHRLRHPRPDRGHDHGRPHRRHEQGQAPAGGHAARGLREAGQPVRRRASSARRP